MLRRYVPDECYVLWYNLVELDDHLTFIKECVAILDKDLWGYIRESLCG